MATLKGSNFRVGVLDGTDFTCYGMATSCSITRNTQTDDARTKDDIGLAAKPTITSKSTQIQVESLNVLDAVALLRLIKSLQPLTLMWDETSTDDNQTALQANCSRLCQAYLNDCTFTFNDRETAAKSLQFVSTGPISSTSFGNIDTTLVTGTGYTKGQFVRLFLSSDNTATPAAVIAAAKQLSLHVSVTLESATTKDTMGDDEVQEPTGIAFDISSNALMRSGDTITSSVNGLTFADIEDIYENADPVKFAVAFVSGDNQRTKGNVIMSGSVIISQLTANAAVGSSADYSTTLNGYGDFTVGA